MDPFIHSHFHRQVNPSHNDDVPLVIIIYEYSFVSSIERSTYIFSNFLVSTVINLHMVKVNAKILYFLRVQVPHLHLSLHFVKSDDMVDFTPQYINIENQNFYIPFFRSFPYTQFGHRKGKIIQ